MILRHDFPWHNSIFHSTYREVSVRLRELKQELPSLQRALATVRYKLNWISEKKVVLKDKYLEVNSVKDEMEKENQMKVLKPVIIDVLAHGGS